MKKNLRLLLLAGLAISIGFTSCSEDEETTPTPTPTTYNAINSYSAKLMGGQTNATVGSFLATDSGKVYTSGVVGASTSIQGRIDFVYFFGTSNQATIAAPSDSLALLAHTNNSSLPTWTTKNSTKFAATTITPAVFTASANDSLIKTIDATTITGSYRNMLTVGNVVAFKTASGKVGLFHVSAIAGTTGVDRTITLDVKVSK